MDQLAIGRNTRWAGVALIALTGLIHLVEAPEYGEKATYIGVLFVVNALLAGVAAIGIVRNAREWGWALGLVVAAGAVVAYFLSRTTGLPSFREDEWFDLSGVISMAIELLFSALAVRVLSSTQSNVRVAR